MTKDDYDIAGAELVEFARLVDRFTSPRIAEAVFEELLMSNKSREDFNKEANRLVLYIRDLWETIEETERYENQERLRRQLRASLRLVSA